MRQFALALFGLAQLVALSSGSSAAPRSGRELFDRLPGAQQSALTAAMPTPYPDNPLTRFLLQQELERPSRRTEASSSSSASEASLWAQIGDAHDHQQRLLDVIDEAESYEARIDRQDSQNKTSPPERRQVLNRIAELVARKRAEDVTSAKLDEHRSQRKQTQVASEVEERPQQRPPQQQAKASKPRFRPRPKADGEAGSEAKRPPQMLTPQRRMDDDEDVQQMLRTLTESNAAASPSSGGETDGERLAAQVNAVSVLGTVRKMQNELKQLNEEIAKENERIKMAESMQSGELAKTKTRTMEMAMAAKESMSKQSAELNKAMPAMASMPKPSSSKKEEKEEDADEEEDEEDEKEEKKESRSSDQMKEMKLRKEDARMKAIETQIKIKQLEETNSRNSDELDTALKMIAARRKLIAAALTQQLAVSAEVLDARKELDNERLRLTEKLRQDAVDAELKAAQQKRKAASQALKAQAQVLQQEQTLEAHKSLAEASNQRIIQRLQELTAKRQQDAVKELRDKQKELARLQLHQLNQDVEAIEVTEKPKKSKKKTRQRLKSSSSLSENSPLMKLTPSEMQQVIAWLDLERNSEILKATDAKVAAKTHGAQSLIRNAAQTALGEGDFSFVDSEVDDLLGLRGLGSGDFTVEYYDEIDEVPVDLEEIVVDYDYEFEQPVVPIAGLDPQLPILPIEPKIPISTPYKPSGGHSYSYHHQYHPAPAPEPYHHHHDHKDPHNLEPDPYYKLELYHTQKPYHAPGAYHDPEPYHEPIPSHESLPYDNPEPYHQPEPYYTTPAPYYQPEHYHEEVHYTPKPYHHHDHYEKAYHPPAPKPDYYEPPPPPKATYPPPPPVKAGPYHAPPPPPTHSYGDYDQPHHAHHHHEEPYHSPGPPYDDHHQHEHHHPHHAPQTGAQFLGEVAPLLDAASHGGFSNSDVSPFLRGSLLRDIQHKLDKELNFGPGGQHTRVTIGQLPPDPPRIFSRADEGIEASDRTGSPSVEPNVPKPASRSSSISSKHPSASLASSSASSSSSSASSSGASSGRGVTFGDLVSDLTRDNPPLPFGDVAKRQQPNKRPYLG